MKSITIQVSDEQYEFAKQLLDSLDLHEVSESEVHESDIAEWQKEIVRNRINEDHPQKRYILQEIIEGIRSKRGK
jgi:hypothetical protein